MLKRIIFIAILFIGCTDSSSSRETLQKAGFTDITITGWSPFSCGEDDTYSTGFSAKNPNGQMVEGVVCCGMIVKSCTVRF